jgi:hypothetical protein
VASGRRVPGEDSVLGGGCMLGAGCVLVVGPGAGVTSARAAPATDAKEVSISATSPGRNATSDVLRSVLRDVQ